MGQKQTCLLLLASTLFTDVTRAQTTAQAGFAMTLRPPDASASAATRLNGPVEERRKRVETYEGAEPQAGILKEEAIVPATKAAGDTLPSNLGKAGANHWQFLLEGRATGTTAGVVPFWMRANQYGSVPLASVSGSLIARVERNYTKAKPRFWDWGLAAEGRANGGEKSNFTLIEGFAKLKLGPFSIRAGRVKSVTGLVDSTLSSGAFSESGNALGVPKAEIMVPEFSHILGGKLFAFKGNLAHGWLGEVRRNKLAGTGTAFTYVNTYLHQKSFYARLGKDNWKVRLYGGFNHQVFWGNEKIRYGSFYSLSTWETYLYVFRGVMWEGISSKIGNHLGSVDLGFELNLKKTSLLFYRQNFYDIGALYYLANIKDGLHGLRLVNKAPGHRGFQWHKILFEFLYSKSQAGEPSSPDTKSGAEDYYNSSEYLDGWSYKGQGLGNPFLSTKTSTRSGFASAPNEFFNNNRVLLFHTGMEGRFNQFFYRLKLSYSKNYGTWATSSYGKRTGGNNTYVIPPIYGIFNEVPQFSSYVEVNRALKNGLAIGGAFALDRGALLYNSVGFEARLAKSF